jgi:hypothetical protein
MYIALNGQRVFCLPLPRLISSAQCRINATGAQTVFCATTTEAVQMNYPNCMDHVEVLRGKIGCLRVEIAQIQELNKEFRLRDSNGTGAQVAHGQRHERLQAIQQK